MRIKLFPRRGDETLALVRLADKIIKINNDTLDLSSVPEGSTIDAGGLHPLLEGSIEMTASGPEISITFPIGANASQAQCFPADIVNPPIGPIALPQPEPEDA